MKTFVLAAALVGAIVAGPALAQDAKPAAAPAAAPTVTQKAVDAVKGVLPGAKPAAAVKLVNINTATTAELDALPKIGAARLKAIMAGRPYKSVDELLSRKILPQDAYDAVKTMVAVK